ncbi:MULTISPECIES: efflux transporter outer membrane subunit [unclassified Rhizobium]|uniref:efflux transporter outer membrane subunit n=1 Tax=unclassified Rhizobium TaxID=2613769 RepID=UPI0007019CF6|nr:MULTISPECIES: efflux transporter outer membrane subunit [unclassified Rhizobium]KQV34993.1 nodulation protein NodT [Rhizobium sp. Root1212]KRD24797.1 nodulation protein NodT [Rhizobium sp. Root268]
MKTLKVLLPLSLLLLSGCMVGPDYQKPDASLPGKFSQGNQASTDVTLNPWWEAFRDNRLNSLVTQGMNENLDVQQSLERIVEARANVIVAASGGLPQINAGGAATAQGTDGSYLRRTSLGTTDHNETKTLNAGADVSWLLDFFGQYRRAKESAEASLDASYDDVNVARLAYLSDLTASYIEARYNQEALALQRKNLESRRETLKLTNDIKAAGAASSLDVVQAEGLVNTTLAELPGYEAGFNQAANHIATLLGLPATSITASLQKGTAQPWPRYNTKIGIPADLVRNRPDIRRAERLLAAQTAAIGVAEAQLYPSLTLGGTIDVTRTIAAAVGSAGSWSFGPSLSIPVFSGGRLKANVDIAKSGAQQQYLAWKQTVLNGIEEVENALIALQKNYETVAALRKVVKSYEEALSLARESYKGGATSLLDVLDAERNLAASRVTLAASIRNLANNYVTLNVAIGGGSAIETPTRESAPQKVAATQ